MHPQQMAPKTSDALTISMDQKRCMLPCVLLSHWRLACCEEPLPLVSSPSAPKTEEHESLKGGWYTCSSVSGSLHCMDKPKYGLAGVHLMIDVWPSCTHMYYRCLRVRSIDMTS